MRREEEGKDRKGQDRTGKEKLANTQEKDVFCIQRNERSVKSKLIPHSHLFRDDSASGVPVSHSCAVSIHWTGRIHMSYL